jgi:tetraacyldisaccharide-1-P 4'-kinase
VGIHDRSCYDDGHGTSNVTSGVGEFTYSRHYGGKLTGLDNADNFVCSLPLAGDETVELKLPQ